MAQMTVVDHPLIRHKLSLMRDKDCSTKSFRSLLDEIGLLLCYEVTRDLPEIPVRIETPLTHMQGTAISTPEPDRQVRSAARAVRSDIGMVFQHFNLWPHLSVLENLIEAPLRVKGMSKDQAVAIAETLLAKVDLSDKRDAYPTRLSGGQQQRVAIARALAMSPKVLLFDEATSALDPELRREVLAVMRQLAREGMTMLVVTHEMGFARHVGTRTVFMDRGEIVEEAPGAAFFDSPQTERAQRFLKQFEEE